MRGCARAAGRRLACFVRRLVANAIRRISTHICAVQFAACGWALANTKPAPDGMPTYADFERSIHSYPYLAPPERADSIKRALKTAKPCMDKSAVLSLLGKPDYSHTMNTKH
jgi:hypothetical protein